MNSHKLLTGGNPIPHVISDVRHKWTPATAPGSVSSTSVYLPTPGPDSDALSQTLPQSCSLSVFPNTSPSFMLPCLRPGVPCATTPPPSFCFPSDFYSWSGAGWDHSDSPALLLSTFLRCWGCAFHRVTHVDLGHSLYSFSLPVLPFISHQLS